MKVGKRWRETLNKSAPPNRQDYPVERSTDFFSPADLVPSFQKEGKLKNASGGLRYEVRAGEAYKQFVEKLRARFARHPNLNKVPGILSLRLLADEAGEDSTPAGGVIERLQQIWRCPGSLGGAGGLLNEDEFCVVIFPDEVKLLEADFAYVEQIQKLRNR